MADVSLLAGLATEAKQDAGNASLASINGKTPTLRGNGVPVTATNVVSKLRDASEDYPNPTIWDESATVVSSGDIILDAGNTAGAGWIEISKSPFVAGTSSQLELLQRFNTPIRIAAGLTMSQRTAGQHIGSLEFVSTDDWAGAVPIPDPVPVEILNASQTTTTITLNFASAPATPFRVGQRVNVYGFADNRLNVSGATVATVPSSTQITIVGNAYTFASTTIGATLGSGAAFVERVDVLGGARNGVAILHENVTATNRAFYSRSEGGLARPSGTLAGAHAIGTGTDAATVLANLAFTHAFAPAVQTRLDLSRDGFSVSDRASNGANAIFNVRYRHDEVVPNPARPYKVRYRMRAAKAMVRPIAEIVSATKSGSAIATIVTRTPHGLTTGQFVGHYGISNQTSFAAQTTGVAVTVVNATTFTCTTGASATGTAFGGFVWVWEGQQALPGAVAQAVVSAQRAANVVTLTGSAAWTGPAIGELIEVFGVTNATDGTNLGLDGTYRVENVVGTALTLSLAGSNTGGGDIGPTTSGGAVIRRTSLRIHYTVAVDFDPMLIEFAQAGFGEQGYALGVNVVGTAAISGTVTTNEGTVVAGNAYVLTTAATTNGALIKSSAATVFEATVFNATAATIFVKLYNKATSPTVGTDIPVITIPVAAGALWAVEFGRLGKRFAAGLGIAVTASAAATDATAVAAGAQISATYV